MRWRKFQGSGVTTPSWIGSSVTCPAVWAHRMGMPLSKMTAELLRDTAHAKRRQRAVGRSMTVDWRELRRGRSFRASNWGPSHRLRAYVLSTINQHSPFDTRFNGPSLDKIMWLNRIEHTVETEYKEPTFNLTWRFIVHILLITHVIAINYVSV